MIKKKWSQKKFFGLTLLVKILRIIGGEGYDIIKGGSGDDKLIGGLGFDIIDGGDDHDTSYDSASDIVIKCEEEL